jgi:drug/metabolite transporter (DMT)-like permease
MRSAYLPLALAVGFVSLGSVLIRVAAAPALSVSFHRMGLAVLCLAPFAARSARRAWPALSPGHRLALAGSGIALAVHFATWIASLSYTSVAASVLLVNTAPLFAAGLSRALLGERVRPAVLAALGVALLGAGLIAAGDWTGAAGSLGGILLALAGAVTLAVYHVIGRGLRDALPLPAYVLGVWSVAAVVLGGLALGSGAPLAGFSTRTWLAFLALALLPTLAGHGLVNLALRGLPAPTVGLFLLGEPVAASALAWLVLGETPGALTLAGGAVVLAALVLVLATEGGAPPGAAQSSSR